MTAVDNRKTEASAAAPPMLDVIDVWKSFAGVDVLRGIDLEAAPGQVMCLLGPSGSGKSTLLRCINHLTGIDAGRITVAGRLVGYDEHGDMLTEAPEQVVTVRRREIGMVFQHFNLFPPMFMARPSRRAQPARPRAIRSRASQAGQAAGSFRVRARTHDRDARTLNTLNNQRRQPGGHDSHRTHRIKHGQRCHLVTSGHHRKCDRAQT